MGAPGQTPPRSCRSGPLEGNRHRPADRIADRRVIPGKTQQVIQFVVAAIGLDVHHDADSAVRKCEDWLKEHYREPGAITRLVEASALPERTLKRRFKDATGTSLLGYLQNLRIEEAKRALEQGSLSVEEVSVAAGYEDVSFFRRLFKRLTGLTPGEYRRLFRPLLEESEVPL
ncbi:MAG: helix-turn-helix transcriptional regulator [Marinobacter sp.]|nr:helix-turn-helix transcriptional regulator [Marinobacter sp.]